MQMEGIIIMQIWMEISFRAAADLMYLINLLNKLQA